MRCPFCASEQTLVRDSRQAEDGLAIRRRRQCQECGGRFSTLERVQLRDFMVVKSDGRRVPFERDKLTRSIAIACRKRGVDAERIEKLVTGIVRQIETSGEQEVTTGDLGERAMQALAALDEVAYVRFASVYKDFSTARDFEAFIGGLAKTPPAQPE